MKQDEDPTILYIVMGVLVFAVIAAIVLVILK
jgi:hypothetical protein